MGQESYYLEYITSDEERIFIKFDDENNRDGCHISLDMYKVQLGPVTKDVLLGIVTKFHGQITLPDGQNTL